MRKWLLAGLGASVAVVVALLLGDLWSAPDKPKPEQVERAARASKHSRPPPAAGEANAPAVRRLRHVPTVDEVGEHEMELLLARDVPQRILRGTAPCYGGETDDFKRMRVNYTLHFDDGVATLSDVELVASEIGSPELEACVVDTMRELSWRDQKAPNLIRKMEAEISVLDLKKRQARKD
jgi:hypothetical protein